VGARWGAKDRESVSAYVIRVVNSDVARVLVIRPLRKCKRCLACN
jgi:hypothetical protein